MNGKERQSLNAVYPVLLRDVCASDIQDYLFEMAVLTLDDLHSLDMERNSKVWIMEWQLHEACKL